jgi:hypothetical protein
MIKAMATSKNGPVLVMGITREDLAPLLDGQVCSTNILSKNGIEAIFMLMAGQSEEAMADKLRGHAGFSDVVVVSTEPLAELANRGRARA